jgi:hypothetical protein
MAAVIKQREKERLRLTVTVRNSERGRVYFHFSSKTTALTDFRLGGMAISRFAS